MFCLLLGVKTKKSASVEAHQGFGALRIGTLRDHESVALLIALDVHEQRSVARKSEAPEFHLQIFPAIRATYRQLHRRMSKAHVCWGKITSLCRPELDYLFAFNLFCGSPVALFHIDMNDIHIFGENILPPKKPKAPSGKVPFLSGEMVPISGLWRPDHSRCPQVGDIWLRKQTSFPPCPGCSSSAGFALVEEIMHISEDPDFQ